MDELWALDATGQAEAVRSGACTPAELAEAARRRVAELDPTVGAIVGGLFSEPVGKTRVPEDAPFHGVPLLLKDAGQQLAGTPHWIGTAALHAVDYRGRRCGDWSGTTSAPISISTSVSSTPSTRCRPPGGPGKRNPGR